MNLKKISDSDLHQKIKAIVQEERNILTDVLHHLAEIERRRLFSDYGCSSLYDYGKRELGYSDGQIHRRISAMRLIRVVPEIEEKISAGTISLTNLAQAQAFFNQEKKQSGQEHTKLEKKKTLESLEGKSSRQACRELLSQSQYPTVAREQVKPVSMEETEIKLIVNDQLLAKLDRLKGLLAHKKPGSTYGELINNICDIALTELQPKKPTAKDHKKALTPSAPNVSVSQKHALPQLAKTIEIDKKGKKDRAVATLRKRKAPSQSVKRIVWHRDDGECTLCGSAYALEFDHIQPFSKGGGETAENLRLICRSCNQRAAIREIGLGKMEGHLRG